jgi:hypothetical protein
MAAQQCEQAIREPAVERDRIRGRDILDARNRAQSIEQARLERR